MTDTIIKEHLALRQISREVYHYHYPKEITASTLRELASKGALDLELFGSVTLFYRASVNPETKIDAQDVMAWLTTCIKKLCELRAADETLVAEAEAS